MGVSVGVCICERKRVSRWMVCVSVVYACMHELL